MQTIMGMLIFSILISFLIASGKNIDSDNSMMIAAGLIANIIFTPLLIYLNNLTLKSEDNMLLLLVRPYALFWRCWKRTNFTNTILSKCEFNDIDIKYIQFSKVKLCSCIFNKILNLHLALFQNTPLESRKVRDLVIDGIITDKNFSTLDLRGLDFSNLNLEEFDFSHANLCGANLSNTKMTGAILESWNIDTETILDNIDCKYYYYLENGEKKRMPPEGEEYKAGEFSRIFQKIANTIDFIAHNEMELAAIKLSVEQIRVESGNDAIHIQAIEEKDGFIVVKVNVPKNEDRGILYHDINSLKQEYEIKIQALMADNYIQTGKIEILKEQLKEQREDFLNKIEGKIIMNNPNISTTITDSTVHGSVATAEKIEHSFNSIQQLPDNQNELKALLIKLETLINNSALNPIDKQDALQETQTIAATAAQQPNNEKNGIIRRALNCIRGITSSVENASETVEQIGTVITEISQLITQ